MSTEGVLAARDSIVGSQWSDGVPTNHIVVSLTKLTDNGLLHSVNGRPVACMVACLKDEK